MAYLFSFLISNIFDLPMDPAWIKKIIIPNKTFGVFVTVHRSESKTHNDVHGCIGSWNDKNLIDSMVRVGYSAVFEDSRNHKFPPILSDPYAKFTISWMLGPLYTVDSETGRMSNSIPFDNSSFGLIVTNSNGSKATYLPNVFENKSWRDIRDSLLEKANISNSKSVKFTAYQTEEIKFYLYQSFTGDPFCLPYINLLNLVLPKVPYNVDKNKNIEFEPSEWVRNLAVIEGTRNLKCAPKNYWKNYDRQMKEIFEQDPKLVRQALTSAIEMGSDVQKAKICKYLLSQMDYLEPDFERPLVLIALLRNCGRLRLDPIIKNMMNEKNKSIFRLNWDVQLLYEWNSESNYIQEMDIQVSKIVKNYNSKTMTNELAVSFECISYLMSMAKNDLLSEKYLMTISFLLWQRWDYSTGLFKFLDGDQRVDITNHILNGQSILN